MGLRLGRRGRAGGVAAAALVHLAELLGHAALPRLGLGGGQLGQHLRQRHGGDMLPAELAGRALLARLAGRGLADGPRRRGGMRRRRGRPVAQRRQLLDALVGHRGRQALAGARTRDRRVGGVTRLVLQHAHPLQQVGARVGLQQQLRPAGRVEA